MERQWGWKKVEKRDCRWRTVEERKRVEREREYSGIQIQNAWLGYAERESMGGKKTLREEGSEVRR